MIDSESEIHLDQERQRQAKKYARIGHRLMIVDLVLGAFYAIAWLVFGWSAGLKSALLQLTTNDWLLVLAYMVVFGGIYFLIDMPLSFWATTTAN